MATVEQYASGWAAKAVKVAVDLIQSTKGAVLNTEQGEKIKKNTSSMEPLRLNEKQAIDFIQKANKCAVGERICKSMFPDARHSESIFLDELAEALVEAGKATYIRKMDAQAVLRQYPGFPIVISKVSGKYMEICRSWPKNCVYWNMEKYHVNCITKINRQSSGTGAAES